MNILHSRNVAPVKPANEILAILETVEERQLRQWVEHISRPRNFAAEPKENSATGNWLCEIFASLGYIVEPQGQYGNIVALPDSNRPPGAQTLLIGAHYDSVPLCPGADDNGSAIAAMLGCAAACRRWRSSLPVAFVAFNREEDGLLGSDDFVKEYLPRALFTVGCAHILEMVGYASCMAGSQRVPTGLPIDLSDTGDFLGLLANQRSQCPMEIVLARAATYLPELPVAALTVPLGVEKVFPVLARSDHIPFWERDIPAVMWTDTSEFRNPNYHRPTDRPETLNYPFLRRVTQLLTASVILGQE